MPTRIPDAQMRTLVDHLQQDGRLSGVQEGDAIELVNVSAAPEKAFHTDHSVSFEVGAGGMQGALPQVQPGDHLRVRTRSASGQVSNWISLQAGGGIGEDTRNAQIGPRGLGITVGADGVLRPSHLGGGMLSEPNAQLLLKNLRTGEETQLSLDDQGRLPEGVTLNGQAGDRFQLAVNDGTNNGDFSMVVVNEVEAKSVTDLDDPLSSSRYSRAQKVRFSGPLFLNGASASDVKQGSLGNCYFCAAAATVAHFHPEMIEDMMKNNGDGTYTVTFNVEEPPNSGQHKPTEVTVDGELYVRSGSRPSFGAANEDVGNTEKMEMWFPILEKAYAALKDNGYQNIESGWSHKMMMMFTGAKVNDEHYLPAGQADQVYERLAEAAENGWPGTAVTYAKNADERSRYSGSRIYASHAYSVLGVEEKDGQKFVQLRNPWGSSEPGYDGTDDGIFLLEVDKFMHYFQWLNVTHSGEE